ncbi:hypothetical protein PDJAM_G00205060 [Pangasius djambal]|uniref:Uncharacterized protein n=1 Tax=Pangasius djambal TaxID=1691987 RepID=A0ACC5YA97_9TELE|nr:hypothetical protein [Pangasius djambal]
MIIWRGGKRQWVFWELIESTLTDEPNHTSRVSEKSRTSQPASQLFRRTGVALTSEHGSPNQPIGTLFRGSADENKSPLSVV